jgi:uncharacterized protein YndB with AHSA1/START domain
VWRALTELALLEAWLMPNDIAPVVGHSFAFQVKPVGDFDGTVHCEVQIAEPPHRLRYTWRGQNGLETAVTWSLKASGTGTLLLLEQSGFRQAEDKFAHDALSAAWRGPIRAKLEETLKSIH